MLFLFLSLVLHAQGAVSDLRVIGSTPTQILISFVADDPASCTIEVSKSSGYTPLAADVDPAIFGSTADDCNRSGNVVLGKQVIAVIGKQGPAAIEAGLDGYTRSRANQANTVYYVRVTQGTSATIQVRTANIPLGASRGEALAVNSVRPFEYDSVTANAIVQPDFPDPYTGALIRRPVGLTWGYGGSTSTWADGAAPADCNRTLSSPTVKGSCLFADASGTGWAATDAGTLGNAIRGNDSNYAETTGNNPLFVRLGTGKYPTSSTSEQIGGLTFQSIAIRGVTSTGTEAVDACWWMDVNDVNSFCISPPRQFNLTSTESHVIVCQDAPCTTPDQPGDIMFDKFPGYYTMFPNTRVYNVNGDLFNWRFTGSKAQETCDGIIVGQYLYALDSRNYSVRTGLVSSKSCGSSPPRVTVTLDYELNYNGTTGVTLFKLSNFADNPNIGIRIRKVNASAATVKIGYVLWRAAVSTPWTFALGSGGFGKRCQTVPLAGTKEYLCQLGGHIVGLSYGANGLTLKNYGFFYVNTNLLGLSGLKAGYASYNCIGSAATNDSMWSDTVPGRFYCSLPSSYHNPLLGYVDERPVVVELDLDVSAEKAAGDPDASGAPGLSAKAQRISFTAGKVVTPCLTPCSSTSDDYTPFGQLKRFDSSWDHTIFNRVGMASVQGSMLFLTAYSGSQDSHGWIMALDLGNGQPIGGGYVGSHGNTQHLFGGFNMSASQAARFCAMHTYQAPIGIGGVSAQYSVVEAGPKCPLQVTGLTTMGSCSILNNNCSACPNVSLDGYNYSGKNWCGTLTVTSSWNGAWGSTPAAWTDGDPVAPNGCENGATGVRYWGQHFQVGDWITSGGEYARILEKIGNVFTLIRGWGAYFDGFWNPKAHSNGDTWYTACGAYPRNPEGRVDLYLPGGVSWWPVQDPHGTNAQFTYYNDMQNHAGSTPLFAFRPEYPFLFFTPHDPASLKSPTYSEAGIPTKWAGADIGSCSGNYCEKHPVFGASAAAARPEDTTWIADVHPRLSHPNGANAVAAVAGKSNIWKWQGPFPINAKLFDVEAYTAFWPFRRIDTLTDNVNQTGGHCWAVVADNCFVGSVAGTHYFTNEAFDTTFVSSTQNSCHVAEFGSLNGDICFGATGGISASTTQWRIPNPGEKYVNGSGARVVAKYAHTYRLAATENVKTNPEGNVLLARGGYYIDLPPFPMTSTVPSTFQSFRVPRSAVPAGTATMHVLFGYDQDYKCNRNRDDACWAETAVLNEADPYKLGGETLTGLPCTSPSVASPCVVTVPAVPGRVLHWSVVYRNSGGTEIFREPRILTAVN